MGGEGLEHPAGGAFEGSVWTPLEPPQQAPSLAALMLAAVVAVFVSWLVRTLLVALTFFLGVMTSDSLTSVEQFHDRLELSVLVFVVPIVSVVYLFAIRAFCAWIANHRIDWLDAVGALAIMVASVLVFGAVGFGAAVLGTLAGSIAVAILIRVRAGRTAGS